MKRVECRRERGEHGIGIHNGHEWNLGGCGTKRDKRSYPCRIFSSCVFCFYYFCDKNFRSTMNRLPLTSFLLDYSTLCQEYEWVSVLYLIPFTFFKTSLTSVSFFFFFRNVMQRTRLLLNSTPPEILLSKRRPTRDSSVVGKPPVRANPSPCGNIIPKTITYLKSAPSRQNTSSPSLELRRKNPYHQEEEIVQNLEIGTSSEPQWRAA